MADNITCNVCGGTNFHKESGFYYCNECQTQSQDIQERVFAIEDEDVTQPLAKAKSSKRIRAAKKTDERLTSWECYNYILRGLVEELIELGADVSLRKTVRVLWFLYLNKLEVTNSPNEFPKLSAINSKIDAEIVYGRSSKRKRRLKRSPSPSSSSEAPTDSSMSHRERSKKRRNLVLAQYDELSATLQSEDTSLYNQSLTGLRTSDDSSKDKEKYLQYNKYAERELLKQITKNHLNEHKKDIHSMRTCHQQSYRTLSIQYVKGPTVLSRIKIYALLYLALLINKDNIQLGDLIRFIREGNLSYHNVHHFFPEDFHEKLLNIKRWNDRPMLFTHSGIRRITAELAQLLGVASSVPIQNLLHLCRRYCNELNLPDEVWAYSINLMAKVCPRMKFTANSTLIPNYEGRVLSIIIFVLKLLLGLDGKTEKHFSSVAKELNESLSDATNENMFVWNDWIYHVLYRKLLLTEHHFPTNHLFDEGDEKNLDLSVKFLNEHFMKDESDVKFTREGDVLKVLLERFREKHCEFSQNLKLDSTLTPFRSYIDSLVKLKVLRREEGHLMDVLQKKFQDHSFKFLINPLQWLNNLDQNCKVSVKHRGANNRIKIIKFKNLKTERTLWRKHARKETFVKVTSKATSVKDEAKLNYCSSLESATTVRNSNDILRNFYYQNTSSFKKYKNYLLKLFKKEDILEKTLFSYSDTFNATETDENHLRFHYNPHERYWLKNLNVALLPNKEFLNFYHSFPKSFRDLFEECARISEQEKKELFEEFNDVEVYLCYVAKFSVLDKYRINVVNKELSCLIAKALKNW